MSEALEITAKLRGAICLPYGPIALDSLLAWAVALRDDLPPPASAEDAQSIQIPVDLEPNGSFHLASFAQFEPEQFELRHIHKRAPLEQYQAFGDPAKIKRVTVTAGQDKSYRIPTSIMHLRNDEMRWFCIGDGDAIWSLLQLVTHLGKKRSAGFGRVDTWSIAPVRKPWPGFPVAREGKPLRTLPEDWPGLVDPPLAYRTLSYPYWDHTKERVCACPDFV